jgi:hypothetical protein
MSKSNGEELVIRDIDSPLYDYGLFGNRCPIRAGTFDDIF